MNVELVIAYLKDHGGYTPASEPIHILEIDFHFDGVLRGPDNQNGLVLIHQASGRSLAAITTKIRAFTLALDRSGSMRIVTLVIVGSPPDASTFTELSQLCRVLTVFGDTPLQESLATLLPLSLPTPLSASGTADAALKEELENTFADPFVTKLIKSARESEGEVKKALTATVNEIAALPKLQ